MFITFKCLRVKQKFTINFSFFYFISDNCRLRRKREAKSLKQGYPTHTNRVTQPTQKRLQNVCIQILHNAYLYTLNKRN